jgi:hypothetical protein
VAAVGVGVASVVGAGEAGTRFDCCLGPRLGRGMKQIEAASLRGRRRRGNLGGVGLAVGEVGAGSSASDIGDDGMLVGSGVAARDAARDDGLSDAMSLSLRLSKASASYGARGRPVEARSVQRLGGRALSSGWDGAR